MKNHPKRTDTTRIAHWWWTVDRIILFAFLLLIMIGAILITAASPPVAARIGLDPFYFVIRQHLFLSLSTIIMLVTSILSVQYMRRLYVLGFIGCIFLLAILPFVGSEAKGAIRWISLGGISLQPSELIKPCFAIVIAWIISEGQRVSNFPAYVISFICYIIVAALLIIQPDFGMTFTISIMFATQLFLSSVPIIWVIIIAVVGAMGVFGAYNLLPHVAKRINDFLYPIAGGNYQVEKSLQAFKSGGIVGRGPGEGIIKWSIPDSHTDFIFSVAGEEFGILATLLIIALYMVIIFRGFYLIFKSSDMFITLAVSGLLMQIGVQAVINMGVAVNLLPTKGMTLPFLSYGGSSLVGTAIAAGMIIGLTSRRFGAHYNAFRKYDT